MLYLKRDPNETPIKILGFQIQRNFDRDRTVVHYTRDSLKQGWSSSHPLCCHLDYLESDKLIISNNWDLCSADVVAIGNYLKNL